eukprot:gene15474-20880_t
MEHFSSFLGSTFLSTGAFVAVQLNQFDANNEQLRGGSTLSGKVLLNIEKEVVTADSLKVKFYGRESTKVKYETGSGKHRSTHYAYETHNIVDIEHQLAEYPTTVSKGKYEYPFEIRIPEGLPAKRGSKYGSNWFAIEYFFEARLHRHGFLTSDVSNSTEILLGDPLYDVIKVPSFIEPINFPVFFFCCFQSGTMSLSTSADNTNIVSGDQVTVGYGVHNESTSRVKALEISISQLEQYSAQNHSHDHFTLLSQIRIEANQLEGVAQMKKGELISSNEYETINDTLRKLAGNNTIALEVPAGTASTYNGFLGSLTYNLQVQIKTPFCVDDPLVNIPITVHYRSNNSFEGVSASVEHEYQLPSDWNPVPAKMVVLPSAPPISTASTSADVDTSSVSYLVNLLQASNSWSEVSVMKEWITYGDLSQITSDNIGSIFSTIKGDYSYTLFPDIIGGNNIIKVTSKMISSAALNVPEVHKPTVCYSFSKFCIDKENAKSDFSQLGLTSYALESILQSY